MCVAPGLEGLTHPHWPRPSWLGDIAIFGHSPLPHLLSTNPFESVARISLRVAEGGGNQSTASGGNGLWNFPEDSV